MFFDGEAPPARELPQALAEFATKNGVIEKCLGRGDEVSAERYQILLKNKTKFEGLQARVRAHKHVDAYDYLGAKNALKNMADEIVQSESAPLFIIQALNL